MDVFLFWGGVVSLTLAVLWSAFLFRFELRLVRKHERRLAYQPLNRRNRR